MVQNNFISKILVLLFILLFLAFISAKSPFTAPEGLMDELKDTVENSYEKSFSDAFWAPDYNAPNYKYSDGFTTKEVSVTQFGEFLRAIAEIRKTGVMDEAELNSKLEELYPSLLQWQWTPKGTNWGLRNGEKAPSHEVSIVKDEVRGVLGSAFICAPEKVPINEWLFSKGSRNYKQESSPSDTGAAISAIVSGLDAPLSSSLRSKLEASVKNAANNLVELIVVPNGKNYGISEDELENNPKSKIPLGFLPGNIKVYSSSDSESCSDGALVDYTRGYKHEMLEGAIALQKMYNLTKEEKYKESAKSMVDTMFTLRECDGFFSSYMKFGNDGANEEVVCYKTDGSKFNAYQSSISVVDYKEPLWDTILVMYLTQEYNPSAYNKVENFSDTLDWLKQIEEEDSGSGIRKEKFKYRRATEALHIEYRAAGQSMLSSLFMRAACNLPKDSAKRTSYVKQSEEMSRKAIDSINKQYFRKPKGAVATETGKNILAIKALAEVWEIYATGCSRAPDLDSDGFYDDSTLADNDCNDRNASIHPEALEVCDLVDNDCDGKIDEGFDKDNDGISICKNDCNDSDKDVFPGAKEKNDGKDNDCDGKIDEMNLEFIIKNEGSDLTKGIVSFYLYSEKPNKSVCASLYEKDEFSEIAFNCESIFSCDISEKECLSTLKPQDYLAIYQDGNLVGGGFFSLKAPLTKIEITAKSNGVKEEIKEEKQSLIPRMPNIPGMESIPKVPNTLFIVAVAGGTIGFVFIVFVVVFLYFFMISTSANGKHKQELRSYLHSSKKYEKESSTKKKWSSKKN